VKRKECGNVIQAGDILFRLSVPISVCLSVCLAIYAAALGHEIGSTARQTHSNLLQEP